MLWLKTLKAESQDNSYIEIISGVALNDRVISAPFRDAISKKLSDSTLIEVVKKRGAFQSEIKPHGIPLT